MMPMLIMAENPCATCSLSGVRWWGCEKTRCPVIGMWCSTTWRGTTGKCRVGEEWVVDDVGEGVIIGQNRVQAR